VEKEVTIRQATQKDTQAMVELWKEMIDFHKELDRFFTRKSTGHQEWMKFITDHISKETSCVLVAECKGRIVGYSLAIISEYPPVLTIKRYGLFQDLAITADYRRCGIGESLFAEMLKWFREHGIERMEVRVSVRNELSTAFWRKMGFKPYIETLYLEISGVRNGTIR
jgi:GNAT superfamily N-acetyltransferase